MSEDSTERTTDAESMKTDQTDKPNLTPVPSLPKEQPRKKLAAPPKAAQDELETLRRALEEEKARSKEYSDRLKYLQADFENSMKRLKREVDEAQKFSNEQLILKLVNVAENLERAIEAGEKIGEKSELTSGVKMISKQLNEILEQEGLERILAEGEKFNPTLHEAFSQRETEEKADGTILKELERGYMFKGKMLRPSKVEVAKNPILKK
jgi:molecular chaperone GrpE